MVKPVTQTVLLDFAQVYVLAQSARREQKVSMLRKCLIHCKLHKSIVRFLND